MPRFIYALTLVAACGSNAEEESAAPIDPSDPVLTHEYDDYDTLDTVDTSASWSAFPVEDYTCFAKVENLMDDGSWWSRSFEAIDPIHGGLLHMSEDYDLDGRIDSAERTVYNTDGQRAETTFWYGDETSRLTYSYDAQGNLILFTFDEEDDGVFELLRRFSYDGGNRLLSETREIEGVTFTSIEITYDDHGHRATFRVDDVSEGTRLVTYGGYEGEHWTDGTTDLDADGTIDWVRTQALDDQGRRTAMEERRLDDVLVARDTWSYPDDHGSFVYSEDRDGDGIIDYQASETYDADGQLTAEWRDSGADGELDFAVEYHPEGYGPVRSFNGFDDETFVYDDDGRVQTKRTTVRQSSGTYTFTGHYDWSCP